MTGCRALLYLLFHSSACLRYLAPSLLVVLGAVAAPRTAWAVPYDGHPKILLHLAAPTVKSPCAAGKLTDCGSAVVAGSVGTPGGPFYFAYVLAAKGNLPDLAGIQLGIRYQEGCVNGREDGNRIDVFGWTLCGTLEFPSSGFYSWPSPNSSNTITWDNGAACQTGETAVAGYFYVGCYGAADTLSVIPRPVDQLASVARCNTLETNLTSADLGRVVFSPGGVSSGCNPCAGPCAPAPTYLSCGAGVDVTPPAPVTLSLRQRTNTSLTVQWQAPGDDANSGGPASAYDLRIFHGDPPYIFEMGTPVPGVPVPGTPGTVQFATATGLLPLETYTFLLRTADEVPNWSGNPTNLFFATTLGGPPDPIAPAAITDLAQVSAGLHSIRLGWTATGNDGSTGTATSYEMRYSSSPITTEVEFANATPVTGMPSPTVAGSHQEKDVTGLTPGTTYYFAIVALDVAFNRSPLSNSPACATLPQTETIPPAAITDLKALSATLSSVRLGWTAPGDDGMMGTATLYDIRYSASPITAGNFASASQVGSEPAPQPAGTPQEMNVVLASSGTLYYFAIKTIDNEDNVSGISNVVTRRTSDNSGARLLLHNRVTTTKNQCAQGQLADCGTAAVSNGALYPNLHFTYLLAGRFGEIGALQCGLQYDLGAADGDLNRRGIDIYSWTLCATQETPSTAPAWPKPGSGNLITWNTATLCQNAGTAVAGYFYVGAYGVDLLQLTPRPSDGLARVYDCPGTAQNLTADALGSAGFGRLGYNPCTGGQPSLPVQPTSWSQIKTLLGH
ncbi:MAG TPA: hypothetical protein VF720_00130 [Candidatus Eisenbacteria bacterium]